MAGMDTTEPAIVLDSLNAHAAVLGLAPLERPYSVEEAIETAGPDGVLVAVVEIPLSEMFTAHDREEDGEKGLIASTKLLAFTHVSNVLGIINPVADSFDELAEIRASGAA